MRQVARAVADSRSGARRPAPAGLTTLAQSLRSQGVRCARKALALAADVSVRHEWRVVVRTTTRRPLQK
jgi:hypothetical protein